ncbi:MAG: GTPase, partial [Gammaproteobacteria bacterium]
MDDLNESLKLRVPEQRLTSLSFCEATPRALQQWVSALPMANIGETAKQLYHAQTELNQLMIAPAQRFALMELIRDPVYFVCEELSKHFLNQPVVLPDKPRKIANLCQALQMNLANGYKHMVLDSLAPSYPEKVRRMLATACHRAISDLSRTILRASQLYSPSPTGVWLEIHQLFAFAEHNQLLRYAIEDNQNQFRNPSTIGDAYHRILMLGCAKPNQVRQRDLAML